MELGLERIRIQAVSIPQDWHCRKAHSLRRANVIAQSIDESLRVLFIRLIAEPDARAVQIDPLRVAKIPFNHRLIAIHSVIDATDEAVILEGLFGRSGCNS